jgi:hypothetical protein
MSAARPVECVGDDPYGDRLMGDIGPLAAIAAVPALNRKWATVGEPVLSAMKLSN